MGGCRGMRRPLRYLVLLGIVLATPGCTDSLGNTPADAPTDSLAGSHYLSADGGLVQEAPAAGSVLAPPFFAAWQAGNDYPTFRTPPLARATLIDDIEATIRVRFEGPVAETGRFPDLMVYAGVNDAWMGYGSADLPAASTDFEGDRQVDLDLPIGGLWLPAGATFGIKVVPVMVNDDNGDIFVVTGPEASRVSIGTSRAFDVPVTSVAHLDAAGTTTGSAYSGDTGKDAGASSYHAIVLDATATTLTVWMNTTSADGLPDLDLALIAADGTQVASAGTPTPQESLVLRIAADAIPPGDYDLVVTSYGAARASYSLAWLIASSA